MAFLEAPLPTESGITFKICLQAAITITFPFLYMSKDSVSCYANLLVIGVHTCCV